MNVRPSWRMLVAAFSLTAIGALSAFPAQAAGWGALFRDGPIKDLNDEDMRLLLQAVQQTLDGEGREPVEWSNPASRASGRLTVLGSPRIEGYEECRQVRSVVNSARRRGMPVVVTACRPAQGRWLIVRAN